MRYRFAREGIDTIIGNHLEPGSLTWSEVGLPVSGYADWDASSIIGMASDVRREDDGWLTAEVKWNERGQLMCDGLEQDVNDEGGMLWLTIYATDLTEEGKITPESQRIVHRGTIKALFVTLSPEDPWTEGPFNPHPPNIGANRGAIVHPLIKEKESE